MEEHLAQQIRDRLNDDLAHGKTIVLSAQDLENAALRRELPQLLEDLERKHAAPVGGGPVIEGYTILGKIGQGGMSSVYLARQDALGRHVAIKILPTWLDSSERARARLVQEAHALARVRHPNIVVIHDIIESQDVFAIAMEWVDGRTLADILSSLADARRDELEIIWSVLGTAPEQRDRFESSATRTFVRMMRDIALATQAVHDAGLLHLDIKPSNVLVRRDGTPLLADFGVVREIAPEMTHTRTFAGTPAYASPEQIRRRDNQIGPRSDVYSLGLTLYELLSRKQPLKSLDLTTIVQCVESGRVPRLSQLTAISVDLENVVHKAIAPEPEHRYASAREFADDLDAFLEGRPVRARPLSGGQRLRRWIRTEPWQATLAAALALLLPSLAVLGTYLVLQMPAIEQVERQRQKARANQLKQRAYQEWLTRSRSEPELRTTLVSAMELDTDDSSVVAQLALVNQFGWFEAERLLANYQQATARHRGLQLFAKRCADQRTYFDDAEVAELNGSEDPIDHYLLALDRMFWANDRCNEASYRSAQRHIECALLTSPNDPLLYGLLCWVAIHAEDHDVFEAGATAIRTRWPTDPVARSWPALSAEPFDRNRCERIAREIIAFAPRDPRGYEVLSSMLRRSRRLDEADRVFDDAEALGVASPMLRATRQRIASQRDPDSITIDTVKELQRLGVTTAPQLSILMAYDRDLALAEVRRLLGQDLPSAAQLQQAYRFLQKIRRPDLGDMAFQRHLKLYRDRHTLFPERFRELVIRGEEEEAAQLAAQITLDTSQRKIYQQFMPRIVRALLAVRDWQSLRRQALHWQAHSTGVVRQEAAYYAGMAAARLGDFTDASERLATALHERAENKTWYALAQTEDAWVRIAPDTSERLRSLPLAQLRMREFERLNRGRRNTVGPFIRLIRAEILLAADDPKAALEEIHAALQQKRGEHQAPANWRELLLDAKTRAEKALAPGETAPGRPGK